MRLSTLDRKILNFIQEDIPLCPQPFKILAHRVRINEDELLKKIKQLKQKGIIRSFSAGVNHKKLKFQSTLLALKVSLDKLESTVKKIIGYPEVTHCYLREGDYNLWVVFLCLEKKKLRQFLSNLTKQVGRENILNFPTVKQFKLKTRLKI